MPLALTDVPETWLRGREFLLLKKHFDVFTNPNAEPLLELLDPDEVILFGVATDVCDDAAILGLLDRGRHGDLRRGGLARPRRGPHARLHDRLARPRAFASPRSTRPLPGFSPGAAAADGQA